MSTEKNSFFKVIEFDKNFRNDTSLNYANLGQGLQTREKTIVEADLNCDQRIYGIDVFSDDANRVLLLSIWDGVSIHSPIVLPECPEDSRLIGAIEIPKDAGLKDNTYSVCLAKSPELTTYFNRKDEMGKSYMCIPKGYSLRAALTPSKINSGGTSLLSIANLFDGDFYVVVTGDKIGTPSTGTTSGGTASGGTFSGGISSGGTESGGTASGTASSGGTTSGGTASSTGPGGTASGGTASGGTASGGSESGPSWGTGITE